MFELNLAQSLDGSRFIYEERGFIYIIYHKTDMPVLFIAYGALMVIFTYY